MTDTTSSTGGSSSFIKFPFRKKRPVSGSSGKSDKKKKEMMDKTTTKTTETHTEALLEPFQEMVDEINWDTLDDGEFPMQDVSTDKPVASQAVAFVIRASRRGVIPLCAEVANLLKENSSLEQTVNEQNIQLEELQKEVVILREAVKGPRPVMVDFGLQTIQENDCQTMTVDESSTQTDQIRISCIRQEDIKSLKLDLPIDEVHSKPWNHQGDCPTRLRFGGVSASCGSDVILTCSCSSLVTTATQNPIMVSIGSNTVREDCMDSALGYFEHISLEKSHRELEQKHSNLTEIYENAEKQKEDLGVDLKSAKKEIVLLQKAIQDIQNKEYEREREEEMMRREETYSVDVQDTHSSDGESDIAAPRLVTTAPNREEQNKLFPVLTADATRSSNRYNSDYFKRPSSCRSTIFPGPILGCKCHMCMAFFRSSGILGFACSPYLTDGAGKNPVLRDLKKLVWLQNTKLQIQPNDEVIARNNRLGIVRYVGHLDGVGSPNVVYVGIELGDQGGRHDGYLNGKRYFVCPHKRGLFIPLQDVICVINRKANPPSAHPPIRRPPAITSFDSKGKIASVTISDIKRRKVKSNRSNTSSFSSSSRDSSSSTNSVSPRAPMKNGLQAVATA